MKLNNIVEKLSHHNSDILRRQISNVSSLLIELFQLPSGGNRTKLENKQRPKAHANTERFWIDPNSHLHSWLHNHQIILKPEIPPYKQGGAGRAYFIGDEYVVKMSANRVEANVADMVKEQNIVITPIIDVTYLDDNIYAILQYFVDTNLPTHIAKASNYLTLAADDYPDMEGYPTTRDEQESLCRKILNDQQGDMRLLPHMIMILDILAKLYSMTGFKHDDAGPTNIGMMDGNVVITDLGPNETGDFDQLSTLSKIRKNREKLGLPKRSSI